MKDASLCFAALVWCLGLAVVPVDAVVFLGTGDPHHNTTPPTGALAESGWELQGDAQAGVPIASNFFIVATHVSGKVGGTFSFHGVTYPIIATFEQTNADLTICQVEGTFSKYAPLYSSSNEVGKPLVVFGRGSQRGEPIRLNGVLKGWTWGEADGVLRWGENVVAGISDQNGKPATAATKFQLLRADFDSAGGTNEAHLSGGDSGGSVFIRDGDVWKLAGINRAANQEYSPTAGGAGIKATLFDESGFFEGEKGKREYNPDGDWMEHPGSFYATRISAYLGWIQSVISGNSSNISLEESSSLLGPFSRVAAATIDTRLKTIRVARPTGTRFYRVRGDHPYVIRGVREVGGEVALDYQ